ncbi:MAG: VOC family protein [Solirubrobacterales bacterium]
MSTVRLDHAILAVRDLDAAAAEVKRRYGFGSVAGGTHPAWGTANRIVPLGSTYLELMAVADETAAAQSWFGRHVAATVAGGERLLGWVVATDDIEAIGRRLGLEVSTGSRARPDGSTLTWRLAGLERAMRSGALPFFIQWDGPTEAHPGAAPVEHRVRPSGYEWIEVSANGAELREWLGPSELPLRVVEGPPSIRSVGIGTENGQVVVR